MSRKALVDAVVRGTVEAYEDQVKKENKKLNTQVQMLLVCICAICLTIIYRDL